MDILLGEGSRELFDPSFRQQILLDMVGCMGLTSGKTFMDPYCIIRLASMEVHRTKPCFDTGNPIWTIRSNSLCAFNIPTEEAMTYQSPVLKRKVSTDAGKSAGITIDIMDGPKHLGTCSIPITRVREILHNQPGERMEFPVEPLEALLEKRTDPKTMNAKPILALRIRHATVDDLIFLGKHPAPEETDQKPSGWIVNKSGRPQRSLHLEAADLEFREVRRKNLLQFYSRRNPKTHDKEYRVLPGPDPRDPVNTEWMTKEQIKESALEPSHHFVQAGTGTVGKCYVEVLSATDLPNMDLDVANDKTDPFVAMVFEDCMVRTDMLWDELNPKWMPWTMRAFCFHMRHPSSLLLLGVFDYDEAPIENHDAVGRVVINVANFEPGTTYLLHYNLQHDPRFTPEESKRGQITIRLRVEWGDERKVAKMKFSPPPKCIINCKTDKTYQVLRYLKRGPLDMEDATMDSIKVYMGELGSYWIRYCAFLDTLFEIFLWRGRLRISGKTKIWFPHHSIAVSVAVLLALEYPHKIGPILLYSIVWVLMTINFHNSRHPYPWKRVQPWLQANSIFFFGRQVFPPQTIPPNEGVAEGKILDTVNEWRGQRMSALIYATLMFMYEIYKIYSTTSVTAKFFSTMSHSFSLTNSLLGSKLYYPHMMFKYLCKYTRLYLQFINWDGNAANTLVFQCFILATVWLFLPVNYILLWIARVVAWTLLGPWMKLVDIYFVRSWYKNSEELFELVEQGVEEPEPDLPNFESILQGDALVKMSRSGRLVAEKALKLKDMRDHIFGSYSEFIPFMDDSRYPSIPLPASTAEPYKPVSEEKTVPKNEGRLTKFVHSQKLRGTMVLIRQDSSHNFKKEGGFEEPKSNAGSMRNGLGGSYQTDKEEKEEAPSTPPRRISSHVKYE